MNSRSNHTEQPTRTSARESFLSALLAAGSTPEAHPLGLDSEFRATLLAFGSETEDNLNVVHRIGIGEVSSHDRRHKRGPVVRSVGALVAEILNYAEGSIIPPEVHERFPHLEQADWDAVLRLATLVLIALEFESEMPDTIDDKPHQ